MPDTSPRLGMPFIMPSQAQKHVTHNAALETLDALVQLAVISRNISASPTSPAVGDCYVVGAGATDLLLGQEARVAVWQGTVWSFVVPKAGWRAWVLDETAAVFFDGAGWSAAPLNLQNLPGVGIGTASDAGNPLSVAGAATLLSHAGARHQLKINKAAAGNTASLLFQDNWSGRAEMGLAGSDNFQVKVSPDGSSFTTALEIAATTGVTQVKGLASGYITINPDSVGLIQTPGSGGFVFLNVVDQNYPQIPHSGIFAFDTGLSLLSQTIFAGASITNMGTAVLTGTSAPSGTTGFAITIGALQVENRSTTTRSYAYTFLGV
jgi:hypothetical protein